MEQTKHLRLSGHSEPVLLDPAAHERLLRYLADARLAMAADPDVDETVRDIEASLGDTLQSLTAESGAPVDDAQMARVLAEIGAVESDVSTNEPLRAQPRGRFWCRIDQGKWFGGICLGIAARGEFRIDWVRTIVIFATLLTGGSLALVYLVLLLVLPRVDSVDEYRRLRDGRSTLPQGLSFPGE